MSSTDTKWTLNEFFQACKVIRMLYGVQPATYFFETNLEEMTGFSLDNLYKIIK